MSVIVETSLGDFTVDLYTDERPKCCKNFLKLCKIKYYNYCLFHSVQRNFIAQTGDPSGTGKGGESVYGVLYGDQARYFDWEFVPKIKHMKMGQIAMVNNGNNMHGSQFFVVLGNSLDYLDGVHTVFGEVTEGLDVIEKLNEAYCDDKFRPYRDVRIHHTIILDDPYDDPPGLDVPDRSPSPTQEVIERARLAADAEIDDMEGKTEEEVKEIMEGREERANAQILEMIGDLPSTDITAPENVLFVCKLNSVTTDEDLEIIFSRFGAIKSCEVIRDHKTGESLQYAFIEFEKKEDCESAYFKMDNVLIDDRRIHVDFSQSVSKFKWKGKGKGVETFDEPKKPKYIIKDKSRRQDNNYDLVFDENGDSKSSQQKHKHRSPDPKDQRYKNKQSFRSRSRSPRRSNSRPSGRDRREDRQRDERRYSPPDRSRGGQRHLSPRRHSPDRRNYRSSDRNRQNDRLRGEIDYRDRGDLSRKDNRERHEEDHWSSERPDRGRRSSERRDRDRRSPERRDRDRRSPERRDGDPRSSERRNKGHRSSPQRDKYRSPPKKMAREKKYSSSESEEDRKKSWKRKSESSDDEDTMRKSRVLKRAAASSDDEPRDRQIKKKRQKSDSSDDRKKRRETTRYDSSSDEDSIDRKRGNMRNKRDSSSESVERKSKKKKQKSVDDSSDEEQRKKGKKKKKDKIKDENDKSKKKKKKKKHEQSDSEKEMKKRRESSSERDEPIRDRHSKSSKNRYKDQSESPVRGSRYSPDMRHSRKSRQVDRR